MPCADCLPGALDPVPRRFSTPGAECLEGRIRCTLRAMWRGYWQRRVTRATVFMLQSLDDRALKDLGIDRTEIQSVVHEGCQGRRRRMEL
jgi:uncharacterized protein YjiS (DUF1127 family)